MEQNFNSGGYTVGVEEELMILDGQTLDLTNAIEDMLGSPERGEVKPELMESVHDAADAMLTMRGQSERQRGYLAGLPFTVRLVLCMWLTDTELAAKLIRVAYSKA